MKRKHLRKDAYFAESATFMNKEEVLRSTLCGCIVCNELFSARLIEKWDYEMKIDENNTTASALCPYCGCDKIIPESEAYTLDKELIEYLHKRDMKKVDKFLKKNKIFM